MFLKGRLWFVAGAVAVSWIMKPRKRPVDGQQLQPVLGAPLTQPPRVGEGRAGAKEEGNAMGKDPSCFLPVPFPFFLRLLLLPLPPS